MSTMSTMSVTAMGLHPPPMAGMNFDRPTPMGLASEPASPACRPNLARSPIAQHAKRTMAARYGAGLTWALVGASVVFWGHRVFVAEPARAPYMAQATDSEPSPVGLARLLGEPVAASEPAVEAPAMQSRFQLSGVVAAAGSNGDGVALIAIDGAAARNFRVGAAVTSELVLQSVGPGSATLGLVDGPPGIVLQMQRAVLPGSGESQAAASLARADGAATPSVQDLRSGLQPARGATDASATVPRASATAPPAPGADPAQEPALTPQHSPGRRMRLHRLGTTPTTPAQQNR